MKGRPLKVTHEFVVEFTDYVELDEDLYTKEQAHEVLWHILYNAENGMPFTLNIKE